MTIHYPNPPIMKFDFGYVNLANMTQICGDSECLTLYLTDGTHATITGDKEVARVMGVFGDLAEMMIHPVVTLEKGDLSAVTLKKGDL